MTYIHGNYNVKPTKLAILSINEEEELRAQKAFYERVKKGWKLKEKLRFWKKVSLVYNPIFALAFASFYLSEWLKRAEII